MQGLTCPRNNDSCSTVFVEYIIYLNIIFNCTMMHSRYLLVCSLLNQRYTVASFPPSVASISLLQICEIFDMAPITIGLDIDTIISERSYIAGIVSVPSTAISYRQNIFFRFNQSAYIIRPEQHVEMIGNGFRRL